MRVSIIPVIVLFGFSIILAQGKKDIKMLKEKITKFVPVELKYDTTLIDEREKIVVEKLYRASKVMDEIFREQVYAGNENIKNKLEASNDEYNKLALEYFNIMSGPFDRLEHDKPFWGKGKKPLGANFYPADMAKLEFNNWIKNHPEEKDIFTSEFTVIRKYKNGLKAIPYSLFYKDKLDGASQLLKQAADYCDNASLKKYLELRADAFATNDYFA